MPVKILFRGSQFNVCGWLNNDRSCAVELSLINLGRVNRPDFAAMIHLLKEVIPGTGLPPNEQQVKYLKGEGKGLFELRARGGTRILGFLDGRRYADGKPRLVICTQVIPKLNPKRFTRELARAQLIREQYFNEGPEAENNYAN
jgi:hypothetical protein